MIQQAPPKGLFKSKTVWFNLVTAILAVADFIPPPAGIIISTIGNTILRVWFTDRAISIRGSNK